MKNFDLNALGITEMEKNSLIEVNGGELQPSPSPLSGLLGPIVQFGYLVYTILLPQVEKNMCDRASKDGYVMYADVSHR